MKKFFIKTLVLAFILAPSITLAQVNYNIVNNNQSNVSCLNIDVNSIQALFSLFGCILTKSVWPVLLALSVIVFVIGVIKYISNADDESKRTEGRNFMIYGIIALFVMVSVWGLVAIIQGTFGLSTGPVIPQLPQ